ncbi:MAG: Unknown protein [uncultured Sulfurovum sp.]|uniref:Restriction endonuclease type IV Mrr domain-containing protein n=1 Tax=uncultured Sulfurovum sp. TaxID=269237 RepID=A0A6S6T3U7_9BACT|nr:MAG: Unknown protein [uncultured Sulfurovum sp.]
MKEIVDFVQEKKLVFKSFRPIEIKSLGSRKKIDIYLAVDLKKYYACIIHIKKKSKILTKEALELMVLHEKLELLNDSKIKKKYIYIQAPLCSKAKALMQENKWMVWHQPILSN